MNTTGHQNSNNWRSVLTLTLSIACGMVIFFTPDWHTKLLAGYESLNTTQTDMAADIATACGRGGNTRDFQDRCNALVPEIGESDGNNATRRVSPEQTISFGTNSTKTSAGQSKTANQAIMTRLISIRTATETVQFAGVQFYQDGQPLNKDGATGRYPDASSGGAAGADVFSRIGLWVNGIFRFGQVDSTFEEQSGYDFHNLGVTMGADYRITDDWIMGGAFTYLSTNSDFSQGAGGSETDLFSGSIYGSYSITDDFYIDGLAFYGGNDYDITRNIRYTLPTDVVDSRVEGKPGGYQYGFDLVTGYDFRHQRLTVGPYVRIGYLAIQVDAYRERELGPVTGWATSFGRQDVQSLQSTIGTLVSYTFDMPWGIIVPQVRGEWHHQFKDGSRTISSGFNGDGGNGIFNVFIEGPERDFYTFGASVSSTFAHGISAFLAYDMLIGYRNVSSYGFTLGARVEF